MTLNQYKRGLGVFPSYRDAEVALEQLKNAGFPMYKVSVLTRSPDFRKDVGEFSGRAHRVSEETHDTLTSGKVLDRMSRFTNNTDTLSIPGVGSALVGGPLAIALAHTIDRDELGTAPNRFVNALVNLGVPKRDAELYRNYIRCGNCLFVVEGSDSGVYRAEPMLRDRKILNWKVYGEPSTILNVSRPAVPPHSTAPSAPEPTTPLNRPKRAVGVFDRYSATEAALEALRSAGFPMKRVSVIYRKDRDAHAEGEIETSDRVERQPEKGAVVGALAGGSLGGIAGLLVGLGSLAIPGIGPVLLAGTGATAVATAIAGGAIGAAAGGVVGTLTSLGIPEERAKVYRDRLVRGHYLVTVAGTDAEIQRAETILSSRGIEEWGVYQEPDTTAPPATSLNSPSTSIRDNRGSQLT